MADPTLDAFFASCPAMLFVAEASGLLRQTSRALASRFSDRLGDPPSLRSLAGSDDGAIAWFLDTLADGSVGAEATCTLHVAEPDGRVELSCTARRGPEGLLHGRLDAGRVETIEKRIEHTLLRALMRSLDIVLWAIDETGTFVFHDGKGLKPAGLEPGQFLGMNIFELYPAGEVEPVRRALVGEPSHYTAEAHGVSWETWNIPLPLDNHTTYCAGITLDVTERLNNQRHLERQLETIRSQQRAIHELSAPLLNVWDHVLAVPFIGAMDSDRTDELTDRLLAEVHRVKTRFAILDLTGVEVIDTSIAGHVSRLLRSLRLLGVEGLVTGVSPQVAQTMSGVGIDFDDITTHRSLREGLRYCMGRLRSD